jgi:hypothetical protein
VKNSKVERPELLQRGRLLRIWRREVAGRTLSEVATLLTLSSASISQWETGKRAPKEESIEALDRLYGASGALHDMTKAIGTPQGLPARKIWYHNFVHSGQPVWAWLRPATADGRVSALLSWGPLRFDLDQACDKNGVIVTVRTSTPNPPARVEFKDSGWVDFGRGAIPDALGFTTINALKHARLRSSGHFSTTLFRKNLHRLFRSEVRWVNIVQRFAGARPDLVEDALLNDRRDFSALDITQQHPEDTPSGREFSGTDWRRLRIAREVSQEDLARLVTALLPSDPVTDDQLRLFEAGGHPRVEHLKARIDTVLRADGHTFTEMVRTTSANSTVKRVSFPNYWVGPIWITPRHASDDTAAGVIILRWGPWQKAIRLQSGTTITCRSAGARETLEVHTPTSWVITAGIGMNPSAIDVNDRWTVVDETKAQEIFEQTQQVYLRVFDRTKQEFELLMSRIGK